MLAGGENAAFYEAEIKKLNRESGWKAPFCPMQPAGRRGNLLKIYDLVIIYKAGSNLNIFKCLHYSLIYSHLFYRTVSWNVPTLLN